MATAFTPFWSAPPSDWKTESTIVFDLFSLIPPSANSTDSHPLARFNGPHWRLCLLSASSLVRTRSRTDVHPGNLRVKRHVSQAPLSPQEIPITLHHVHPSELRPSLCLPFDSNETRCTALLPSAVPLPLCSQGFLAIGIDICSPVPFTFQIRLLIGLVRVPGDIVVLIH